MTEMTTITFKVPVKTLREVDFPLSVEGYSQVTEETKSPYIAVHNSALAALAEAQEKLPPLRLRKLVTKDTKWGTTIFSVRETKATFIGPNPEDSQRFIGLTKGVTYDLLYKHWFEDDNTTQDYEAMRWIK